MGKVFISSTFKDLLEHRKYVISALRKAGLSVDPMEDWPASSSEPRRLSQERVKDCDLCILLVAFRRGHIPRGEQLSITQLEYSAAQELKIDILVFMLKEDADWPREYDERLQDPEVNRWREEIMERYVVSFFDTSPESIEIAPTIVRWQADWLTEKFEKELDRRLLLGLEGTRQNAFSDSSFPVALVDKQIEEEVSTLRKSRFFSEFDTVGTSLSLARRISERELSSGSDSVRSNALAWCARFLSPSIELEKAEEYVELAKRLGTNSEINIAEAFISSKKGDKGTALSILASIENSRSLSAALMIVVDHDGSKGAVEWMETAGIEVTDLSPDGKYILLIHQLLLARWEDARKIIDGLDEDDLLDVPILHRLVALTYLLSAVPIEFREIVLNQLPFEAAGFPLSSDLKAIDARRLAHKYFVTASQVAQQLNCPIAATVDDEYALWLEIRDPVESAKGMRRLEAKLRAPKSALRLVHLGFQFGVNLDLDAVEREIERQIALHGGMTYDAAIARFALAFTQNTPEGASNYITNHFDELAKYIDRKAMRFFQIDMLSRAGLLKKAEECLDILLEEGLSEIEEGRLRRIMAEARGTEPINARKEQFEKTDSLSDLAILVKEFETRKDWENLCEYGQILYERTRSLRDAERLAMALYNANKNKHLVSFLKKNSALLTQSQNLQGLYCWSLYNEGEFLEARRELKNLVAQDSSSYRILQVNLGIAMGDWNSLSSFVAKEYLNKDKRSAHELIEIAKLAINLGSPNAKELLLAAVGKGKKDARILATAYFFASNAGWDDDTDVSQWLHEATLLSGPEGPIQKMPVKDILERKPEWDRRVSETWQMLSRGDIPMFLAAHSVNKSLVELMLHPVLTNEAEIDPRRRSIIPAYSGTRQPSPLNIDSSIAIDSTALLTLNYLELLDKVLDSFKVIYIPHSTLVWLFEERQRAAFHQPSRIKEAYQMLHLLTTDVLNKFVQSTVPDSELVAQVGGELASLIGEAKKVGDGSDDQHIVVRPSPVYRLASLMEEEADITSHASILSSCLAIVNFLRQKGQITSDEENKARAYLKLQEKPWPNQPEITNGAILYLDSLAITYFLHLGLLEKLAASGFKLIASPEKVFESNELVKYDSNSGRVRNAIESIRLAVNSRMESGKIKVGRRRSIGDGQEKMMSDQPTVDLLALSKDCDAIITDDRGLNQHVNFDDGSAKAPIFSTLDVLETLLSVGVITLKDKSEYKTLLRRAGYIFVSVNGDELEGYLYASHIEEGKIIETAELKAIRENILRIRMGNWLQFPKEVPWLHSLFQDFIRVLKGMWKSDTDLSNVKIRSDWIMDQIDIRGWVHSLGEENGQNLIKTGKYPHILLILTPPIDVSQNIKDEYLNWAESRILIPIKEQFPNQYSWIVEWKRKMIEQMAETDLSDWRGYVE